jgi:iron complex outermembrane recepter protein
LEEHTTTAGMRQRFSFQVKDAGHITAGIEYFNEQYDFSTYETLEGGNAGAQLSDEMESRAYLNVFLQSEWTLGSDWYLFGGLNTALSRLSNEQFESETPIDFFPTVGATYSLEKDFSIAGSVSRGYSSLSLDDMLDSDGTLNTAIVPETGWSEEISLKYVARQGMFAKLTVFNMNIKNTVLTRRIMDDVFEKINGGSSIHQGIELEYKWINRGESIFIEGAYTFGDYTFDEFVEGGSDYSGNQLPGTPLHRTFTRVGILPWSRWNFYLEHHWVDEVFLNDANTIKGDGYQLINAGMSFDVIKGERWNGSLSANIHNVFDAHYSPMFQINAPGVQPRYYYPGKPFSVYINMVVSYKL